MKRSEAVRLREIIEQAVKSLDNNTALEAVILFPQFDKLVEANFVAEEAGYRFSCDGVLYETVQPNTSFVSYYRPGEGMESLFAKVNAIHTGTIDDPIPYDGNMALENGKYYMQDNVVYLCTRDTVNPVYNALSELVGLYVEIV